MPELYRRAWTLTVGSVFIDGRQPYQIQPLDIRFNVEKSTKREPNTFSAEVYNLSPEHRSEIASAESVAVSLDAGYENLLGTIFDGDLRDSRDRQASKIKVEQTDTILELEGEDGGESYRTATVQRSFAAGTSVETVLRVAVRAMGVGEGNLRELASGAATDAGTTYPEGTVLSGPAHREVDRIVRSIGLTWSVQNGVFTLRQSRRPVETTAVVLSPTTGLIESPTRDNEGVISARSLLMPDLYPGRKVVVDSRELDAQTYVDRVRYTGDTAGNEWHCELELKEY